VNYGYYDDADDVKELLPHLFNLLDGRKDSIRKGHGDSKSGDTKRGNRWKKKVVSVDKFRGGERYSYKEEYHYEIKNR